MDSYPNPYAALIATFNQVSPPESNDDLDDPQHLPDDDLLLWANAQFTYDIPPGVGIYEDEMGVKLAMSQQQFQQTQLQQPHSQQQQPQSSQPQQQSFQQQQQVQSRSNVNSQSRSQQQQQQQQQLQPHLQYQAADMQHQLHHFDAIHRYLESSPEDPRAPLSLLERSRQRNPVSGGSTSAGPSQQPAHYDARLGAIFQQTSASESSSFSAATTSIPISPAAARLLRQPLLALEPHHSHSYPGYSSGTTTPLMSPTTMSDFHHLQINPQSSVAPANTASRQEKRTSVRKDSSAKSASTSIKPKSSSPSNADQPSPEEDELNQLEAELEEYEQELEENRQAQRKRASSPTSGSRMSTLEGDDNSNEDPDQGAKLTAEEDKRRRNTAASARFRHKKRLREQVLEKTAKEMTAKSELLEVRVRELEMEIKWLRGLIVEKDSRMLDISAPFSTAAASSSSALSGTSTLSDSLLHGNSVKSEIAPGSKAALKKRGRKAQV
ncbi:hypothetical protein BGZ67_000085 [Mortierella alpina]|nr:hypothetical protein BGZ67_000085 [Mortierella alpina]